MSDNQTKPSVENKENSKKFAGSIFRQKSIARVSSPEELNDYIRVVTPSVWMVLIAAAVLLAGLIIWSVFGSSGDTDPAAVSAGQEAYAAESPCGGEKSGTPCFIIVSDNAEEALPL